MPETITKFSLSRVSGDFPASRPFSLRGGGGETAVGSSGSFLLLGS